MSETGSVFHSSRSSYSSSDIINIIKNLIRNNADKSDIDLQLEAFCLSSSETKIRTLLQLLELSYQFLLEANHISATSLSSTVLSQLPNESVSMQSFVDSRWTSVQYLIELVIGRLYAENERGRQSHAIEESLDYYLDIFSSCFGMSNLADLRYSLQSTLTSNNVEAKVFNTIRYISNDNSIEVTGFISGILCQVDVDIDRIVLNSLSSSDTKSNALVSNDLGALFFCRKCLIFTTFAKLDETVDVLTTKEPGKVWLLDKGVKIGYHELGMYEIHAIESDGRLSRRFALSLYLGMKEKISFLPLYDKDLAPIIKQFLVYTGLKPVRARDVVKEVLTQKLIDTRANILNELLKIEKPWIEYYFDLKMVIKSLVEVNEPQSLYELERLYHSCKRELSVTQETIALLQFHWSNTISEAVRHRIMSILDRLLFDGSVIPTKSKEFNLVYRWLCQLEESLNPMKSPEALFFVTTLLERMRTSKSSSIPTITFPAHDFENWPAYQFLMNEYSDFKTKPLWK